MRIKRTQRRPVMAIAAAYALFLHALLTAFALGATATAHPMEGPAAVICVAGKATAEIADDGNPAGDDRGASCCGMQCGPCAPLFILAGQPESNYPPKHGCLGSSLLPSDVNLSPGNDHHPGNPRAPPLA